MTTCMHVCFHAHVSAQPAPSLQSVLQAAFWKRILSYLHGQVWGPRAPWGSEPGMQTLIHILSERNGSWGPSVPSFLLEKEQ